MQPPVSARITTPTKHPLPALLRRELRSNHAGETGSVALYHGALAVTRDPMIGRFARRHLAQELKHQRFFAYRLPRHSHSKLVPLWRAAGITLGASAALCGRCAFFSTVEAVEDFVVQHYRRQCATIEGAYGRQQQALCDSLRQFLDDEQRHQGDAALRLAYEGQLARSWRWLVQHGAAGAAVLARYC